MERGANIAGRRRRISRTGRPLVGVLSLLIVIAGLCVPAAATAFDPAREMQNFAKIEERNVGEVLTPEFQARLQQQNAQDTIDLATLLAGDPERNPTGNICMQRKNECAGDVRFYDWADEGYGLRTPVLFTARSGATISGNVWRTREGPDRKPGIVITTGSVQAPETLYWGIAAALAKRGYVVLTYDVQGQGRSDTFGEGPDAQEGVPSQAGQPFYDGTEDALNFLLSTPDTPYADLMEDSCGNANGGVATSHSAKQLRREGEIDALTGLRHAEPFNPFWQHVDPDRVGIAGHSLGAGAVSYIGQHDPRVKAIAAWDNLRTPDGAPDCPARPETRTDEPITKPAIGFSNDYGLTQNPYTSDPNPEAKTAAFEQYRSAGVDSMQVDIRGGTHYEYSFLPGNTANYPLGNATLRGMHMAVWYTAAWMDKYVKCPGASDPAACEQRADSHLLTDRWRDDEEGGAVDLAGDPNLFSFYLRSRFDITLADGSEARCDDMRSGCPNMVPDGDPAYPGDYSYIAEANSPDGDAPAAPELTDTDPDSPAPDNQPYVKGTAPAGTTVRLFEDAACAGAPVATGSAAELADPGLRVSVGDGETKTFWATATDAAETESACSSSSISYTQGTAPAEPETQIDSGPAGLTSSNDAEFEFSSPGTPTASFECRLDGQGADPWESCSSPRSYENLSQGTHRFEVRAVDAGRTDATPASAEFTVDSVAPPAPRLTRTEPDSPANENVPRIRGEAEAGSLVEVFAGLDCAGPATTVTAAELADPGAMQAVPDDSTTSFSAQATDGAGNASPCSAPLTYVEDSTAPETSIDAGPEGTTVDDEASFAFSSPAADTRAFSCRLDDGPWQACTSPRRLTGLEPGGHTFAVRAVDRAGNADASPAEAAFRARGERRPCTATKIGTDGPDTIRGGDGSDRIRGLSGADALFGRGAIDCIDGGEGADRMRGGSGADRLRGRAGDDRIAGGSGADRIGGGAGDDLIRAADGKRDRIGCGSGKDEVRADARDRIGRGCELVGVGQA